MKFHANGCTACSAPFRRFSSLCHKPRLTVLDRPLILLAHLILLLLMPIRSTLQGSRGLALAGLVALTVVGKAEVQASWPELAQRLTAAFIGGGAALCVARMSYVIWRDLDIVQLQKQLIDASAARDEAEADVKSSTAKIADIRAAGLKNVAVIKPKNWRD